MPSGDDRLLSQTISLWSLVCGNSDISADCLEAFASDATLLGSAETGTFSDVFRTEIGPEAPTPTVSMMSSCSSTATAMARRAWTISPLCSSASSPANGIMK